MSDRKNPDKDRDSMLEEALQKMFGATERETTIYCNHCKESITAPSLLGEEGEIRCPKCGSLVKPGSGLG